MGFFDSAIMWVIGILVVTTIAISAVLPGVLTAIAGVETQGTATGEVFIGTAATAHAMAYKPIVAVSSFMKSLNATTSTNATVLTQNASTNATERPLLNADWDNGLVTGAGYDLRYSAVIGAGSNVTVIVGNTTIATISTSANWSHNGNPSSQLIPGTVTFRFNGANESSISNVSVRYQYFQTSTAYTTQAAAGTLTPTASGGYKASYTYGTAGTGNAVIVLNLVPIMIGVVILLLVITSATWLQGF